MTAPQAQSVLWSKFAVTSTSIDLHDTSISEEEFLEAVCEFCRAKDHARSRLGDLLNRYEKQFGRVKLRDGLISALVLKGLVSRKSCDNARSFAKRYDRRTRLDLVPDAHAETILSIRDERERG
jgi:hypothetical protein